MRLGHFQKRLGDGRVSPGAWSCSQAVHHFLEETALGREGRGPGRGADG